MIDRRAFVGMLVGSGLAAPRAARARPGGKVHRVGVLSYLAPDHLQEALATFRGALRDLGHIEGRNLTLEVRTAAGRVEALPVLAADLVRSKVDVILAIAPLSIRAARQATATVPIVMALGDPATFESLARPGGNVTGVTALAAELAGKQVELIKEALPRASRVAVLRNPDQPVHVAKLRHAEAVARALAVRLVVVEARTAEDFEAAFQVMAAERVDGLIVFADGVFSGQRSRLVALASRARMPAVYASGGFAQAGGLIAYVPDLEETYRRAGSFVDRILRGASPATLPVEQPTRFHLLVNRKTAGALGIALPPTLLLRADEVID